MLLLFLAMQLARQPASSPTVPPAPVSIRLLRSQSGPSGKTVGSKFVLDEVRNRFIYPQDKSIAIYFEWEGPVGEHVVTGLWKNPGGQVASISSDIKLESQTPQFSAYWIYDIALGMPSGVWTLEVRVDGQPAGSHSFELIVPDRPKAAEPPPSPPPDPSLNQIYEDSRHALVWVHRYNSSGERVDTGTGFVVGKDRVATAFENIDGAGGVQIEFEDGRREPANEVWAQSRLQDWAILKVPTGAIHALSQGDPLQAPVGSRLIVYNVEQGGNRVIGGVDFGGRTSGRELGVRLAFSPALSAASSGGPLIDLQGKVIGVIGGGWKPGTLASERAVGMAPVFSLMSAANTAMPISALKEPAPPVSTSFVELSQKGIFTPELRPIPELTYGETAATLSVKNADLPPAVTNFSERDPWVYVVTLWQRKGKTGKGMISATVYDAGNKVRIRTTERKLSFSSGTTRVGISFPPAGLEPGTYRVDVRFNDQAVWRTFFKVTD